MPDRSFNDNRFIFEEVEVIADGLGPTYNAQSCAECHQNVVTGGASQIAEHRTGRVDASGGFFESLGGSLIHSRATNPAIVERVAFEDDVRTFRISTNTLGNGFIECVANETLLAIRDAQPAEIRGTAVMVPVLEGGNAMRVGRFGWKNQHASLESFSADAYLNEMGITSPLFPDENTSAGRNVGFGTPFDPVPEPEDDGEDVEAFANFMRSTKAPSRGRITRDVQAGEALFNQVGCNGCHVVDIAHGAGRDAHQRRRVPRPVRAGEQDLSSVQRLPVARHRHGRRHSGAAGTGVRSDQRADPHGAAVGAADAQPADARRPVVHEAGSDPAPRQPGRRRARSVQRADGPAAESGADVPRFAVASFPGDACQGGPWRFS